LDAQRRIVAAVCAALAMVTVSGDVAILSHGGVGALLLCRLKRVTISRSEDQPGRGGGHVFSFDGQTEQLIHDWQPIEED
jgi:broad specificity phosphatase PhoE